ncbi:hypothetical protein AMTRI_Chr12g236350 [Amborella trichopoda]|uniref:Phospholipid/glycerol acyltransferase domain-containing protein n=1 Tax=Amborella trichopoda TaxID=13333 RepID=W1PXU4_AMBTC|nr:glycerol-3-phosphate acyltransferase 1 [Amborella trichopoda]ERN12706.1 hypothetical protein AMTR_s00179p00032420 [Amborella trichopoda]|eukprot:XP_006851125.1 glycerol-3-phosphate acyltransferase 1 [Amborella trichopoda]
MVLPMVFLRVAYWVLHQLLAISCYRVATKIGFPAFRAFPRAHSNFQHPPLSKCPPLEQRPSQTLVCDINGGLLRTPSFFPYFMLVAFEAGSILRAFLLLIAYPSLWFMTHELALRVMVFISFCGLRPEDVSIAGRAVLPKFFLENLHLQALDLLQSCGKRVVVTSVPRVMVEHFLVDYLGVDRVMGTELQVLGGFFTGLVARNGFLKKHKALKEIFEECKPDIGLGSSNLHDHLFMSLCKESYIVVGNRESKTPRSKYPKPLVFHDGRLAFTPTPLASLAMFLYLPLALALSILRILIGISLPYTLARPLGALTGIRIRFRSNDKQPSSSSSSSLVYVCTHRTLLDPVFLSTVLGRPLTSVTYSLSRMSELLAPLHTVRLTRDRSRDSATMQALLRQGDLVVCPEGTTCREPYLLRFSPLFAELEHDMVPVALDVRVGFFYGTTAGGLKSLDSFFFLMNPFPCYDVEVLERVRAQAGNGVHVANRVQALLANALDFECTMFTRRDKYLMLAGNQGVVAHSH